MCIRDGRISSGAGKMDWVFRNAGQEGASRHIPYSGDLRGDNHFQKLGAVEIRPDRGSADRLCRYYRRSWCPS
ncbi:hypothetical protein D3C86_1658550 [compost metagenome]